LKKVVALLKEGGIEPGVVNETRSVYPKKFNDKINHSSILFMEIIFIKNMKM
jgi:hypothetical protein